MADWRQMNEKELEEGFNPRASLGDQVNELIGQWADRRNKVTHQLPGPFDISYGVHDLETFDLHPGQEGSPLIIFIHGGAWRALDKGHMNGHVFDLHARGWHVANVNYPLCPEVTLTSLYQSLEQAFSAIISNCKKLGVSYGKVILGGHSAGGHAACWLAARPDIEPHVHGVFSVSGVYEMKPILSTSIQADVRASDEEIDRFDLIIHGRAPHPILATMGADEPAAWLASSRHWAQAMQGQNGNIRLEAIAHTNHFTVMDKSVATSSAFGALLEEFVGSV